MPIELKIKYRKNEGLIISPSELKDLYFYGINITNQQGTVIPDEVYETYILAAQEEVEKWLNIKLLPTIISESLSFYREEFTQFGYVRTSFPVKQVFELDGYLGTIRQITYPIDWVSIRTTNDETYFRQFYIVPNQGAASTSPILYSGVIPYAGLYSYSQIPNYWSVKYCTGYSKTPKDLLNFIGKLAAINVFAIAGDLIIGAGIANQSISVDGLNQSIGTTSSATNAGYGARIINYLRDLKESKARIEKYYKGITLSSM